ncbi:hypothetical protein [Clostridium aminobutyricum]|uniref:Uncharacterized protein n=1 Tax=Clostridium aminobutyricum TaxID=33953 RepID=A0A939II64_CLOAM|nr:hypothetical protein [Clostridium aminobutyricum]MBN7772169.1 hypothetical protein [Clostridium aminobutyricum]
MNAVIGSALPFCPKLAWPGKTDSRERERVGGGAVAAGRRSLDHTATQLV